MLRWLFVLAVILLEACHGKQPLQFFDPDRTVAVHRGQTGSLPPLWVLSPLWQRGAPLQSLVPVVSESVYRDTDAEPVPVLVHSGVVMIGEETPLGLLFSPEAIGTACVWAEARSEPLEGKIAVAEVIRNRMALKYFSDGTVAGTVFRPWQFSCMNTDNQWRSQIFMLDWSSPVVQECRKAWLLAMGGSQTVGRSVLYHADYVAPKWAIHPSVKRYRTIGRHIFYEDQTA